MDFVEETSVEHKKKTTADFVVLVKVMAFTLWKSATLTFLCGRSRLSLNICSAGHFIHVSAYGYVILTIQEDSMKVWYDYVVWKFWLFVNFWKYSCSFTFVKPEDTLDLVWNSCLHINVLKRIWIWIIILYNVSSMFLHVNRLRIWKRNVRQGENI